MSMLDSRPEVQVLRLQCADCPYDVPLGDIRRLERHTMLAHFRRPTVGERTPVDTVARFRVTRMVASFVEQLDQALTQGGRLVVDDDGRRWLMIIDGYGITRIDGVWHTAYRADPVRPAARIVDPVAVAALDRWEQTNPTPPASSVAHAGPRPVSQLIKMIGGL